MGEIQTIGYLFLQPIAWGALPITGNQMGTHATPVVSKGDHSKVTLSSYHKEAVSPQLEWHKEYRFGHHILLRFHTCQ